MTEEKSEMEVRENKAGSSRLMIDKTTLLKNMTIIEQVEDEHIVLQNVELAENSDGNLEISTIERIIAEQEAQLRENQEVIESEYVEDDSYTTFVVLQDDEAGEEEIEEEEEHEEEDEVYLDENSEMMTESTSDSIYNENNENEEIYMEETDSAEDPDYKVPLKKLKSTLSVNYCELCERTFNTAVGLRRHILMSHPSPEEEQDDPLAFELCLCCGEPVDSAHTTGDFKCELCEKLFTTTTVRERHKSLEHNQDGIWRCLDCPEKFNSKSLLIQHLQMHPFNKLYSCKQCKREFTRKYHLDRHVAQTGCDGGPRNAFQCQVCEKLFARKDNLRDHLRAHAGQLKPKKLFTCKYCKKDCRGSALLTVHLRTHTGERPYPCDLCPKRFPSSGAMKKHRRMHTGERPYQCSKCNNRFAAKETLNRHIRTHTGEKPHACKFCGKTFIQASQLRAHIFHHTGENAYTCTKCNRAFNRRARLTMHIKFVHDGAKPMECEQCDKTFFRKEDLARHNLLHSGVKPYECDLCKKRFAVKSSLKLHMLTHRKEQPCSCDECGRAFIRQDCLLRHMRAKHRDVLEDIMAGAEKKRLQQQLLTAATNAAKCGANDLSDNVVWNELTLTDSIKELLTLLVDESTLNAFGWPDAPVDKLLDAVIKRCGHKPASEEDFDYIGRLRENAKLLFTVVIDDDAVKSLLNNQTVDEVILHVLRLAKAE